MPIRPVDAFVTPESRARLANRPYFKSVGCGRSFGVAQDRLRLASPLRKVLESAKGEHLKTEWSEKIELGIETWSAGQ